MEPSYYFGNLETYIRNTENAHILLPFVIKTLTGGRFEIYQQNSTVEFELKKTSHKTVEKILANPKSICLLNEESIVRFLILIKNPKRISLCKIIVDQLVKKFSNSEFVANSLIRIMKFPDQITEEDFDYCLNLLTPWVGKLKTDDLGKMLDGVVYLSYETIIRYIEKLHTAGFRFDDCCIEHCFNVHGTDTIIKLVNYFETAYGKDLLTMADPSDNLYVSVLCRSQEDIIKLHHFLIRKKYFMDYERASQVFEIRTTTLAKPGTKRELSTEIASMKISEQKCYELVREKIELRPDAVSTFYFLYELYKFIGGKIELQSDIEKKFYSVYESIRNCFIRQNPFQKLDL